MSKIVLWIVLGYLAVTNGSDLKHYWGDRPPAGCHFLYAGRAVAWTWRRTDTVLCWRTAALLEP